MLGRTPEDVATFLAKTEGLDKTLIGDYLGEREDFNLKVMHAFVDALDFSGLEFDTAIRTFLQVCVRGLCGCARVCARDKSVLLLPVLTAMLCCHRIYNHVSHHTNIHCPLTHMQRTTSTDTHTHLNTNRVSGCPVKRRRLIA